MTIGQRIKNRRLALGLTQEELAKLVGCKHRASICEIERKKKGMTVSRLMRFAEALECSPAYLMGLTSEN